jgi:hypothetical protein
MSLSDIGSRLGKPSGFGGYRNPWVLASGGIFFKFSEQRHVLQTLNLAKLGSLNLMRRTPTWFVIGDFKCFLNQSRSHTSQATIAAWPSRIEVFSGLHDGYFWGIPHHNIVFASCTLHWCHRFASGTLHWCFIVGVSQSSCTGTRLVETVQFFSLPVSLSSFGWGKWHISRFSMFWTIESWPFLLSSGCIFSTYSET